MARKKSNPTEQKLFEQYGHKDKQRLNNPPVGLVDAHTDNGGQKKKTYQYDPHLDPQLQWAGKAEHTSFDVPTVSLHVHERIDPRRIIETVRKEKTDMVQPSLFEENKKPLREAIEFYKHREGWSNRLIAGDSLLVMNSLLEKEGMGGKVQMIYFDPPYGIKYGSNFQPFVNKRDVKDGKDEDLTAEPEMIKAFRDTWELGIHSYLTYIRDRLLLARELLTESGSMFVQISDENVHHVREIMDEVFGVNNFCGLIPFRKRLMPLGAKLLEGMADYIIWYSHNKENIKFRHLYRRTEPTFESRWTNVELPDGTRRKLLREESLNLSTLPKGCKVYRLVSQRKPEYFPENDYQFSFNGKIIKPPSGGCWMMTKDKMEIVAKLNRLEIEGDNLSYILYHEDFPYSKVTAFWTDTSPVQDKRYVVQTGELPIQRCLLMTTDPGDLVLDITCGSGTSAYVAENWGRRWMTCDTSRVAIALAKQRLMTANFDYFELAHPEEGVGSGFQYKTVPHITLKSIANNEPAPQETLYDQPFIDNKRLRVTGPFTMEAVPAPTVVFSNEFSVFGEEVTENSKRKTKNFSPDNSIARSGETLRQSEWRDELLRTGVRAKGGRKLEFTRLETSRGLRYVQAQGELKTENSQLKTVYVVFGPEHAPLEQRTVELAYEEVKPYKPDILLFCALQFDEEAAKDIDEMNPEITRCLFLKAQMNADLFTDDLKKKRASNESFWLIGQPDVSVISYEFLVFSDELGAPYDIFTELSGLNSLAEVNQLSEQDLLLYKILSQGRAVWHYLADAEGWQLHTGKHSGGASAAGQKGIPAISFDSTGFIGRVRDFYSNLKEFGISERSELKGIADRLRRDSAIVSRLKKIASDLKIPAVTKNSKLTTKNYSIVEVNGFDYYNPKTGNVESGGKGDIAMWLLDTDYDGRSIFPSQVFFPMAGAKEGWATIARNLKAEIDEDKIEAFRGTVSLPFTPGKAVAVKIIDARGIESLKIIRL